jgi:hypothetical protein
MEVFVLDRHGKGRSLKSLLSLRYADLKEMMAGLVSISKTLGWAEGARAMAFATRGHLAAVRRGDGLYPEKGKQRVWFKLHYLKMVYDYLKMRNSEGATDLFDAIAKGPTLQFISNVIPPAHRLTRDYTLHHLWPEMIKRDSNILAEARPPEGNSASLRVTRCFISEVARDIGLMAVADRLCYGDVLFWEKYHPNIAFSRTQTLMGGDPICDHTLTWIDPQA